ncbi:MAG TPA: hypothetical protein VIS27_11625 [Yeosuana sp.]
MNFIKKTFIFLSLCFMVFLVSQCGSAQILQKSAPLQLGECYYQSWIAGIEGGGSGIDIYIPIISNVNKIELDSIYFQGKGAKLEFKNDSLVVGRFITDLNKKRDLIMSNEPYAEYGNQVNQPSLKQWPALKNNQCVISYKEGSKTNYFMIDNISKKPLLAYPSAPRNKE